MALAGGLTAVLYLQPWTTGATPVPVELVAMAPVTRVLATNGRIAARHSVDIRSLVGGRIEALGVAEGDEVQAGVELARIDAAAPQAALRQAIAGLDGALVAEAQAQDTLARARALGANVSLTTLETAERAVQSAAQEVARGTALVDQAQVQLADYTLHAPMTGTVLALTVEPGQSIDPSTALMTIADLGELIVETDVDEAYATQLRKGQAAVLQLAGETLLRDGRIDFVSQQVDAATGGLAIELSFEDPVTAPVGLTVTANIVVEALEAALTAPRAAIQSGEAGAAVFMLADGVARRRPVSVIDWPAARLIVTDGLAPGEVLILDAAGISDGQAVRGTAP
ncbi:efflux RND transporter periplasmic adaptor subunit [Frigidibacter albus]|uniref:Efflux RND transporter periplasmic adaptor subunit n=1 Tax=Frigidibacter albus TaxID=1465486 RepID=A0A6L8VFP1_9RHOB|nr:efflux RND transporter periplasmic adaptor subunit [Frigidibacter albus]MZQ89167.1 efflux RND transporter periplasmic adaptor subunit [Frigidibacter albus]NBE30776.1 efflux RND transporter periplasmic adaptor subunit [Frigidibacter albus]GGH51003.1 secretion protein HlyD [Frigidibacter albus]